MKIEMKIQIKIEIEMGKYYENQGRDRNPEIKIAFLFSGFRSLSVLVFYFPISFISIFILPSLLWSLAPTYLIL